jgi:hypothetical protein
MAALEKNNNTISIIRKYYKLIDNRKLRLDGKKNMLRLLDSKTRRFCPYETSEGEQLRFPPSDGSSIPLRLPASPSRAE